MGGALADWYSKHRWFSAKDNTRAQGSVCLSASRRVICDGAFSKWKQPLQAASCHCCSKDHVGRFKRFTPLTANCVQPTSLQSPIFWMNFLLFTCFDLDFLFALIHISSQSFCMSAAHLFVQCTDCFCHIFLGCWTTHKYTLSPLTVLFVCLGWESSQVLSVDMLLFLRHKVTRLYSWCLSDRNYI